MSKKDSICTYISNLHANEFMPMVEFRLHKYDMFHMNPILLMMYLMIIDTKHT